LLGRCSTGTSGFYTMSSPWCDRTINDRQIVLAVKNPLTYPNSKNGLRDPKYSERETLISLASRGVGKHTQKQLQQAILFPGAQVSASAKSSLAEYYGVYSLPRCPLSFIISLEDILFLPPQFKFPCHNILFVGFLVHELCHVHSMLCKQTASSFPLRVKCLALKIDNH
jgi:hypothetical protein